jgi:transcriptional regulator with XRE-family HTH domain
MVHVMSPHEIEAKAKAAGLSIAEVCRRARVAQSTFTRWKAGETSPTLRVYERLCEAVEPAHYALSTVHR